MDLKGRTYDIAKQMIRFVRIELGLPNFNCQVKLSQSRRRVRSYGGARRRWGSEPMGRISIQLNRYDPNVKGRDVFDFIEYAQINDHRTIGHFTGPAFLCTTATIAHEIAHAVEHYCILKGSPLELKTEMVGDFKSGRQFKGHGYTWQALYHILREKFVNPYIPAAGNVKIEPISRDITKVTPALSTVRPAYPGNTNIAMVCNMLKVHRDKDQYWLLNEIMRILPTITKSNAKIYLQKARERVYF